MPENAWCSLPLVTWGWSKQYLGKQVRQVRKKSPVSRSRAGSEFQHSWSDCKRNSRTGIKSYSLKIPGCIWPSNPSAGHTHLGNQNWKRHMYPMFITALFTIARSWKQPRCLSAEEWIRNLWYIYTMEYSVCLTLCDPMNCSTPRLPVHHQLPEFTQTLVHRVSDAIQPSHPLSLPSPPAPNPSQHQSLFQWVNSLHEVAKVLECQLQHQSFQWTPRTDLL